MERKPTTIQGSINKEQNDGMIRESSTRSLSLEIRFYYSIQVLSSLGMVSYEVSVMDHTRLLTLQFMEPLPSKMT